MSELLRIPNEVYNHFGIRELGFALDPDNYNIVYLPIGWRTEYCHQNDALIMIYDSTKRHRATFNYQSGRLDVVDTGPFTKRSLKMQLDTTLRVLHAAQNVLDVLSQRIQWLERRIKAWETCFWQLVEIYEKEQIKSQIFKNV